MYHDMKSNIKKKSSLQNLFKKYIICIWTQKIAPLSTSTRENPPPEMEVPTLVIIESTRYLLALNWLRIDRMIVPIATVNDTLLLWRLRFE